MLREFLSSLLFESSTSPAGIKGNSTVTNPYSLPISCFDGTDTIGGRYCRDWRRATCPLTLVLTAKEVQCAKCQHPKQHNYNHEQQKIAPYIASSPLPWWRRIPGPWLIGRRRGWHRRSRR